MYTMYILFIYILYKYDSYIQYQINNNNKSTMAKNKKKQSNKQSDEQVQDIMAWGKSKTNYYRDQQDQYSQASQQQDQAKQIYQNQYKILNKKDYYQLPQQLQEKQKQVQKQIEDDQQVQGINQEYLRKQILWVTQLAKMFQGIKDQKSQFRKKVYDSYLLILICLKQFKIKYIDQHPLVQNLPQLKKALKYFQNQLPTLYQNYGQNSQKVDNTQEGYDGGDNQQYNQQDGQENLDQNFEQQNIQQNSMQQQSEQFTQKKATKKNNKQGLQIYQALKNQKQQQKKAKKAQNKQIRQKMRPKQAFKLVSENEGRLANQKIQKNKGLMKRRRRDDGNSRTKLRHKYQKAIVRRRAKGYIGVKQNPGRFYQGQQKVLYGKIASTKLK